MYRSGLLICTGGQAYWYVQEVRLIDMYRRSGLLICTGGQAY